MPLGGTSMRLRKLIAVLAVSLVAGAAGLLSDASATSLSGSGSSLIAPLVAEWAQAFQVFYGIQVGYNPTGSQGGITAITGRTADFGATDSPLSSSDAKACSTCYLVPWGLSAVGVGYNVRGAGASLRLTGSVLADIYLGRITRWNDSRIQKLNPSLHLQAEHITPIWAKGSGETYIFTHYLSKVSSSWRSKAGFGNVVTFPAGVPASGDPAIVSTLHSTVGSIAYVGVPYLIAHGVPAAAIANAAGRYEYPNLANIESAGRSVKRVPAGGALQIDDPPRSARTAYPISAFTYALVPAGAAQKSALSQWLLYALQAGQVFSARLDFAAFPASVKRAAIAEVNSFSRSR
jgi:phosphate transport system substrate-binding protein